MYLPIADHAIIGNLHTTALVSLRGNIDFLCLPRFDAPSVFAHILDDEKGGTFSFEMEKPEEVNYKQIYLPGTNILVTRFLCEHTIAEVTDFMPIADCEDDFAIFRRLGSVYGDHKVRVNIHPRYDYARRGCRAEKNPDGDGYLLHDPDGEQPTLLLVTKADLEITDKGLTGLVQLKEGEHLDFLLTVTNGIRHDRDFDTNLTTCRTFWEKWSAKCTYDGLWRDDVLRSALALKLLTSAHYGSTVAAATFGLPEGIGGERNWDYRYTWIRDSAFTMYAFLRLGYTEEAEHFMDWIRERCAHSLQLMYGIDGRKELEEIELDHLKGYKESTPVRIGNGAYDQDQLDIYGELIDTIYLYNKSGGSISHEFWQNISVLVEHVIEHWQEKDHGIWEVRSGQQRFLHSAVCCWVAIDRAMRIADARSLPYPFTRWREARDTIYQEIYEDYWNEELGAYPQFKGSETVDASALLMPLLRFVSSKEPRWLKTFEKIEEKLAADVLIFRYKQEDGAEDGLEGEEASFTICSFWYAECLARVGRVEESATVMQKLLGYGNHVGLFSEEIAVNGDQLGNFPQAFSHLALISAAFQIDKQYKS